MTTLTFDPELHELIEELDIPIECSPEQVKEDLVLSSKMFSALAMIDKKRAQLAEKKNQVLEWFAKQESAFDRSEEFVRGKLEAGLLSAREHGQTKPKITNWAGTAYLTSSESIDWNGYTGKDEKLITLAEKHGTPVKITKTISLSDYKKILKENEEYQTEAQAELGISFKTKESLGVRKA